MHGGFAFLVAFQSVVGHGGGEHVAAVGDVSACGFGEFLALAVCGAVFGRAGGGRVGDRLGEGAVPEEGGGHRPRRGGRREVGLEIDVEGGVVAFAQGGLHAFIVRVGGPEVVDGVGVGLGAEGDVGGGVGCVEHAGLIGDEPGEDFGRVMPRLVGGCDNVDVGVNQDFLEGVGFSRD